jgi:hypothetical protein
MQTLEMSEDNLHVLQLIIMISMFIVVLKLVMYSKLILIKLSIRELDLLKNYLVLELLSLEFYKMGIF